MYTLLNSCLPYVMQPFAARGTCTPLVGSGSWKSLAYTGISLKSVGKKVLYQKPPVWLLVASRLPKLPVVPTMSPAVVKLEKVWHILEMEKVCLKSKSCGFWNMLTALRHNSLHWRWTFSIFTLCSTFQFYSSSENTRAVFVDRFVTAIQTTTCEIS